MPGDWEPLGGSRSQSRLDSSQQFIAAIYKDISSGLCEIFYMTLLKNKLVKRKKVFVRSWNFFRKNWNNTILPNIPYVSLFSDMFVLCDFTTLFNRTC